MTNEQAERLVRAAERIAAALERHPEMQVPRDDDDFDVMADDPEGEDWGTAPAPESSRGR